MGDIYEVPGLYCSLCKHDLNHNSYKICKHPIIEVPLCILCFEDVGEVFNNTEDIEDICAWCGEGGDLLGCEDCEHYFCQDCIRDNLGADKVKLVQECIDWKCFACDPSQLKTFSAALKIGQAQSIFNESKEGEFSEEQEAIERLKDMIEETKLAAQTLDTEAMTKNKKEIEEAFANNDITNDMSNCCTSVEEELELYRSYWQRHYDIVLRQEADLFEQVSFYGYNPSEMTCYKNSITEEANSTVEQEYAKCQFNDKVEKGARKVVEYVEEVVEVDSEGSLYAYTEMAATDPTVLKYASKQDIDPSRYPPSFEFVYPVGVLKALYYGSVRSAEIQELIAKFNIPPHIVLIMSVADNNKEGFTDHWAIASRVHPSVRKALYELSSTVDQAIICSHYQLDEEYCSITDFGDAEDICDIYTETHQGVNPHKNEVNPKNLNELLELEAETQQSKLSVKQIASITKAMKTKTKSEREPLLVKTIQSEEVEDRDEIKLQRQRIVVKSGVKFKSLDENLEEKHKLVKNRTKNILYGEPSTEFIENSKSKSVKVNVPTKVNKSKDSSEDLFGPLAKYHRSPLRIRASIDEPENSARNKAVRLLFERDSSDSVDPYLSTDDEEENDDDIKESKLKPKSQSKLIPVDVADDSDDSDEDDEADDFDDDVTVEGYWDADELKAFEGNSVPPTVSKDNGKKFVRIAKEPSLSKQLEADKKNNVVDLTLTSDDEVEFNENDVSSSGSESSGSSNSDSDNFVADSDESDVIAYGGESDDDLLADEFTQKRKKLDISPRRKLKSKRIVAGSDEDSSDLEAHHPLKTKMMSSSNGEKNSFWSKFKSTKSNGVKPALPFHSSKSNTFDVSAKHFSLFGKTRKSIKISNEELLANHFTVSDESFALNGNTQAEHQELVCIPSEHVDKLKDHQKEGLQFLWENIMESSFKQLNPNATKKESASRVKDHGCLLAHCMGLGKTFTIISFTTTLLSNPIITDLIDSYQPPPEVVKKSESSTPEIMDVETVIPEPPKKQLIKCVLIIVPLVTVENWLIEYKKWVPEELQAFVNVRSIDATIKDKERIAILHRWHTDGGVMVMGYDMFRNLTKAMKQPEYAEETNTNMFKKKKPVAVYSADVIKCRRYLIDPGPDLVVADEAHQLSNPDSMLSKSLNELRTKRRIALTGSPLQNNLIEYFSMVQWIKKGHITYNLNRFRELYVEPIAKGDKSDAHPYDVKQMRYKVHALNKKLSSIVNRKDYSILIQSLKKKRQFILCIKMTPFQQYLYRTFLLKVTETVGKATLFKTYQTFLRLWNHPTCIVTHTLEEKEKIAEAAAKEARANSNVKSFYANKPKNPIFLRDVIREISPTFNHFKKNAESLLAALTDATKDSENSLLKPTAGMNTFPDDDGSDDLEYDDAGDGVRSVTSSSSGLKRPLSRGSMDSTEFEAVTPTEGPDAKKARSESVGNGIAMDLEPNDTSAMLEFASPGDKLIEVIDTPMNGVRNKSPTLDVQAAIVQSDIKSESKVGPVIDSKPPLAPIIAKVESTDQVDPIPSRTTLTIDWWRHIPDSKPSTPIPAKADDENSVIDLTEDEPTAEVDRDEPISDMELLQLSNKLITFLSLLVLSIQQGDKVLMFSQSLYTLNMVEMFLKMKNWGDIILAGKDGDAPIDRNERAKFSQWFLEREYMRIDGTTKDRQRLIDKFNNNDKFKLFMVCTKAGNMGINLYSANRVIIFDSSWNPVHDLQAISRSYRYGQKKEVYVYRLVAAGSMEEVIYKRQMIKQALSARVVDAQMPDNQDVAGELMDFEEQRKNGENGKGEGLKLSETMNQDIVLLQYVDKHSNVLSYIADQEVLLEDNVESHLTEAEKKAAEEEDAREAARDNARNTLQSGPISDPGYYNPSERADDYLRAYQRAIESLRMRLGPGGNVEELARQVASGYVNEKARKKQEAAIAARALLTAPSVGETSTLPVAPTVPEAQVAPPNASTLPKSD